MYVSHKRVRMCVTPLTMSPRNPELSEVGEVEVVDAVAEVEPPHVGQVPDAPLFEAEGTAPRVFVGILGCAESCIPVGWSAEFAMDCKGGTNCPPNGKQFSNPFIWA